MRATTKEESTNIFVEVLFAVQVQVQVFRPVRGAVDLDLLELFQDRFLAGLRPPGFEFLNQTKKLVESVIGNLVNFRLDLFPLVHGRSPVSLALLYRSETWLGLTPPGTSSALN